MSYLISIDAECNGLAGRAFCTALTFTDHIGNERGHVTLRCPIEGDTDPWVEAHVLPAIADIEVDCDDYQHLLQRTRTILTSWQDQVASKEEESRVIVHVAWPVEARLLLDMYPGNEVWDGPFPMIDVAAVLYARGHDPKSVDSYLDAHGIARPAGSPHNPLYDARAAVLCLRHLMAGAA